MGGRPSRTLPDHAHSDDYTQAGERYRTFEDWEREDLIANLVADMKQCPEHIAFRMVWHFWHCDEDYGRRVAEGAGIDLEKAKACRRCRASRCRAKSARAAPTPAVRPKLASRARASRQEARLSKHHALALKISRSK